MNGRFSGGVRRGGVRRVALVGAIDLGVIGALILLGQVRHGVGPLSDPLGSVETIVPFAAGWVLVAALGSPYAERALSDPAEAARTTALSWLAAANVGLVLRSSPWFDGGVEWAFPLVITGFGFVALLAWRLAYVLIRF